MGDYNDYKKLLMMQGRILPAVSLQILKDKENRDSGRDTKHLHPSDLAKRDWCPRATWYTIKDKPKDAESFSFTRLNIFEEGHYIHAKWQRWLHNAGVLEGNWLCASDVCKHKWWAIAPHNCPSCGSPHPKYKEVPLSNEEHHILGHADGIISDAQGKALIEIKSVGLGTIRFEAPDLAKAYEKKELTLDGLWKKIRQPFPSHIKQGLLYMYCTGIHEIVYLYEWKPTQDVKEFSLRFNKDLVQPILDNCRRLLLSLEKEIPPMRPMWAEKPTSSGCKYCPYKETCWRTDEYNGDTWHGDGTVFGEVPASEEAEGDTSRPPTTNRRVTRR